MFSHDEIFTPLALTVVIDTKVREPEMKEFCLRAKELCELFELEVLSEEKIRAWFKSNSEKIESGLKGARKNTFVLRTLTRFQEDMHVENLYEAMLAISISDKEYVREESELIKSAASIWGYQRPPFKVKRG